MSRWQFRWAAVAVITVCSVVGGFMVHRPVSVTVIAVAVAVLVAGTLAAVAPTGPRLAAGLLLVVAAVAVEGWTVSATISWMAVCVVAIWIAIDSDLAVGIAFVAVVGGIFVVQFIADPTEPGWAAWTLGTAFSFVAGAFYRRLQSALESLHRAQAELAERSREQERARIAADVHDVIGHGLTVTLLHIEAARLSLDEGPEVAEASLIEAEQLTRRSLDDVRATVGLMNRGESASVTPPPDATRVADLVTSVRSAGVDVVFTVDGDLGSLGAGSGLALYRIVQEALTNVLRHAPGAAAVVRIDIGASQIRLRVINRRCHAATITNTGEGIANMRHRAGSVGGTVTAGAVAGDWCVEAVLPT